MRDRFRLELLALLTTAERNTRLCRRYVAQRSKHDTQTPAAHHAAEAARALTRVDELLSTRDRR